MTDDPTPNDDTPSETDRDEQDVILIHGSEASAVIRTDDVDDACIEQVGKMTDSPAFKGASIQIMPDAHSGAGAVIGMTSEMDDRVSPTTVGVDEGCGVYAIRLTDFPVDPEDAQAMRDLDQKIRQAVPVGRDTFGDPGYDDPEYDMINDFPWDAAARKLDAFNGTLQTDEERIDHPPYGPLYFDDLCERVGANSDRVEKSMGTMGGGNHFLEIAHDEEGAFWVVVHSGSRGIGKHISEFWQERATERTSERLADLDRAPDTVRPYLDEDWNAREEKIRDDFNGPAIQQMFGRIRDARAEYGPSPDNRDTDLDWLEGPERYGYLVDLMFATTYAEESRRQMATAVADVLDVGYDDAVHSTHNSIDPEDAVIRKGATPARNGERVIIPFDMGHGSILGVGKGNPWWNKSAPHGAGRRGSRNWAHSTLDPVEYLQDTDHVFSTSINTETLDEAPRAYKDHEQILDRIEPTVEVVDTLTPVLNVKAEE